MDVPEIESDKPVTLEQCTTAKKGFYNSPDGKRVQISPGETILYQYIEDGSITVHPTNTYCEGVSLPLHQGTIADQSLVLTQICFSMLHEVYLRTRGGKQLLSTPEFHSPLIVQKAGVWTVPGYTCWMIKLKPVPSRGSDLLA